jgi:hypothetical protein
MFMGLRLGLTASHPAFLFGPVVITTVAPRFGAFWGVLRKRLEVQFGLQNTANTAR